MIPARMPVGVAIAFIMIASAGAFAQTIPYPSALSASNISESSISNIGTQGLVIGNGELNGIVYTSGNDVHLRICKNDSWDMRINTSGDPAMPTVSPSVPSFTGSQGATPSWNNYPYPIGLPCVDVDLAAPSGQSSWGTATLNLQTATATVPSNVDSTSICTLAQSNVFYIKSTRALSFTGINTTGLMSTLNSVANSTWINNMTTGTQSGFSYVCQTIPGDADVSGMSIYMVTGGTNGVQVIAVVTSRDDASSPSAPLNDAVTLVQNTLNNISGALTTHDANWQSFWSTSGVQLGDTVLQRWWYHMLYYNRCFATTGANPVGLKAGDDQFGGWHNSLKYDYNTQQTYFSGGPVNHPEFIWPLINVLNNNLTRAEWFATTNFSGAQGAFFHSDCWPFEPDPYDCTTVNDHQLAYMPWGYCWGMNGATIFDIWDYYQYNPSPASLTEIWPVISQMGTFLCSMLEKCTILNGHAYMGPSFFPEEGNYGEYDNPYDIAFFTTGLQDTEAAATLEGDTALASRCAADLALIPAYSTTPDPALGNQPIVQEWLGEGIFPHDNAGSSTQAVFPAGQVTYFSPPAEKALFERTINWVETVTTHQNSVVMLNISRARLSMSNAISNAEGICFSGTGSCPEDSNGIFHINNQGYYNSECFGVARLVTEYLIQSVGGIIRIFPAPWPTTTNAQFTNLAAVGGFEVSASLLSGSIGSVTIVSNYGGNVSLLNPWGIAPVAVTNQTTGGSVAFTTSSNIITFATTAADKYVVSLQGPAAPAGLTVTPASSSQINLGWSPVTSATAYTVQRASVSGGPYITLATPAAGAYSDTTPPANSASYYVVTALDAAGSSNYSTEAPAGLPPTNLQVTAGSNEDTLSWTAPATGASSYNVKSATVSGGPYTTIASGLTTASYTDNSAANGTTSYYVVSAVKNGFEGANSSEGAAFPAAAFNSWSASPSSTLWDVTGNWTGGVVPANGAELNFGSSSQTTGSNNFSALTVGSFVFDSAASAYSLSGSAITLDGQIADYSVNPEAISFNITLGSSITANTANGVVSITGVISDGGDHFGIVKTGTSALWLGGASTFSGGVTLDAGILNLAGSTSGTVTSGPIGTGTLTLFNGTLELNGKTFANTINVTGTGGIVDESTGANAVLSGALTGSGAVTFENSSYTDLFDLIGNGKSVNWSGFAGTLNFIGNAGPGAFSMVFNGGNNGVLNLSNATVNTGGNTTNSSSCLTMETKPGTIEIGALTGAGGYLSSYNTGGAANFIVGYLGTNTTFGGVIKTDGTSSGTTTTFQKLGTGALTLTGSSTYTGATTVTSGTLNVNGSLGGTAISVGAGGTLGGIGSIAGPVSVATGGALAPGSNGFGFLSLSGSLNLGGGSAISAQLGTVPGSALLTLTGGLGSGGTTTINVTAASGFGPGVYPLISSTNTVSPASFVLGATPAGSTCSLSSSGATLYLLVDPPGVPGSLTGSAGNGTASLAWGAGTYAAAYNV
jgi:autotransporter-associated beta strand protein